MIVAEWQITSPAWFKARILTFRLGRTFAQNRCHGWHGGMTATAGTPALEGPRDKRPTAPTADRVTTSVCFTSCGRSVVCLAITSTQHLFVVAFFPLLVQKPPPPTQSHHLDLNLLLLWAQRWGSWWEKCSRRGKGKWIAVPPKPPDRGWRPETHGSQQRVAMQPRLQCQSWAKTHCALCCLSQVSRHTNRGTGGKRDSLDIILGHTASRVLTLLTVILNQEMLLSEVPYACCLRAAQWSFMAPQNHSMCPFTWLDKWPCQHNASHLGHSACVYVMHQHLSVFISSKLASMTLTERNISMEYELSFVSLSV